MQRAGFRLRPRVSFHARASTAGLVQRIRTGTAGPDARFRATVAGSFVVIRFPEDRQRLWSPQLQFELLETADGLALEGLFMPPAPVWTAFAGLYGTILFGGFTGVTYGLAQFQLDRRPWALWALPGSLLLIGLVYLAARIGQGWGRGQMEELTAFLKDCLAAAEEAEARPNPDPRVQSADRLDASRPGLSPV